MEKRKAKFLNVPRKVSLGAGFTDTIVVGVGCRGYFLGRGCIKQRSYLGQLPEVADTFFLHVLSSRQGGKSWLGEEEKFWMFDQYLIFEQLRHF